MLDFIITQTYGNRLRMTVIIIYSCLCSWIPVWLLWKLTPPHSDCVSTEGLNYRSLIILSHITQSGSEERDGHTNTPLTHEIWSRTHKDMKGGSSLCFFYLNIINLVYWGQSTSALPGLLFPMEALQLHSCYFKPLFVGYTLGFIF